MNEEEELKEKLERYERQNQEAKYKQLPLFTRLNDAIEGKLD